MRMLQTLSNTLALLTALGLARCQVPLDESGHRGAVEVTVIDSFGVPVDGAELSVQGLNEALVSPKTTVDRVSLRTLEYGTYRLTVGKSGFEPASRVIGVRGPLSTVVVALVPGEIEKDGSVHTIKGRLTDAELTPDCQLIRLLPLFGGGDPLDAKLYKGQFTVDNTKPGKYAAVLFGRDGICRMSVVSILLGETQTIVVP